MFPGAKILSLFYKLGLYIWEKYPKNRLSIEDSFIISVGNLTVGGTGKTSFIIWLAKFLANNYKNKRIAVLSRGYKSLYENKITYLFPKEITFSPKEIGDEPYLIAKSLESNNCGVIVGKDRRGCALFGKNKFGIDIFLLDDGFQYPYLERNLDIVLLDSISPFSNNHLLPAGKLRQHPRVLERADIILLTHADQINEEVSINIISKIRSYNKNAPIFKAYHKPISLTPLFSQEKVSINPSFIIAFAGIGNFSYFIFTLKNYLPQHKRIIPLCFRDHKFYKSSDLRVIEKFLNSYQNSYAITTSKDETRLSLCNLQPQLKERILVLRVEFTFFEEEEFIKFMGLSLKSSA